MKILKFFLILFSAAALLTSCSFAEKTESFSSDNVLTTEANIVSDISEKEAAIYIEGSYTARVRKIIPGYILDAETPLCAVITLFQSTPFILNLTPEQIEEIEEDGIYTFTIEKTLISSESLSEEEMEFYKKPEICAVMKIKIDKIEKALNEDYGLESVHLKISK